MNAHPKMILLAGICMLAALPGWGQERTSRRLPSSIRVTGKATVEAKPDLAQIDIGIVNQAPEAETAVVQNRQQLETVLAELKQVLGLAADIQTVSYSLQPVYRDFAPGTAPTIVAYKATNIVRVKTGRLDEVGKIIDLATQSGANTIQRLQFTVKDAQAVRDQALRNAAAQANRQAQVLADALGLKVLRVLSVTETQPNLIVRPMVAGMAAVQRAAPPTPVEPGTVDVHASVTLTVEVGPR